MTNTLYISHDALVIIASTLTLCCGTTSGIVSMVILVTQVYTRLYVEGWGVASTVLQYLHSCVLHYL